MTRSLARSSARLSGPPAEFFSHDPDWKPVWPFPAPARPTSFLSAPEKAPRQKVHQKVQRIRVLYFRRETDETLLGKVWFGPGCEGPPGSAHGGSIAAVLDEAMGGSAWMSGHPVVAASIRVDYKRMIPLGTIAYLKAKISRVSGKKIIAHASLVDAQGHLLSQAEGLFIAVGVKAFAKNLGL